MEPKVPDLAGTPLDFPAAGVVWDRAEQLEVQLGTLLGKVQESPRLFVTADPADPEDAAAGRLCARLDGLGGTGARHGDDLCIQPKTLRQGLSLGLRLNDPARMAQAVAIEQAFRKTLKIR
jgi:hypothetical protein